MVFSDIIIRDLPGVMGGCGGSQHEQAWIVPVWY